MSVYSTVFFTKELFLEKKQILKRVLSNLPLKICFSCHFFLIYPSKTIFKVFLRGRAYSSQYFLTKRKPYVSGDNDSLTIVFITHVSILKLISFILFHKRTSSEYQSFRYQFFFKASAKPLTPFIFGKTRLYQ